MSDSEIVHDLVRTVGFIKRNVDNLNRAANSNRRRDPAEQIRRTVVKATAAALVAKGRRIDLESAERLFGVNREAALALSGGSFSKAVTNPAATNVADWTANLVGSRVGPFAASVPASLYSQLASRSSVLSVSVGAATSLPSRAAGGEVTGAFVDEVILFRFANSASQAEFWRQASFVASFPLPENCTLERPMRSKPLLPIA